MDGTQLPLGGAQTKAKPAFSIFLATRRLTATFLRQPDLQSIQRYISVKIFATIHSAAAAYVLTTLAAESTSAFATASAAAFA